MSTQTTSPASTTGEWLLPRDGGLESRVGQHTLNHLARTARSVVGVVILDELRRCLDDDLVDVLADGLDAHSAVRTAAEEMAAHPGATARVRLARHRLDRTEHVDVHLTASPALDLVVPFDLELELTVAEAFGTVVDGHLTALEMENPHGVGIVRVHGHEVFRREGTLPFTSWQSAAS